MTIRDLIWLQRRGAGMMPRSGRLPAQPNMYIPMSQAEQMMYGDENQPVSQDKPPFPESPKLEITPDVSSYLPAFNEDLAYDEALVKEYYDLYGQLKSFVEGMAKYGVDVTKPDYTSPDNTPYLTFKKLQGDLMRTSQELKARLRREQITEPLTASGFFRVVDPTATTVQEAGYSMRLLPRTERALLNLSQVPHSSEDVRKQQELYESEVSWLNQQIAKESDPVLKQQLIFNRDQLTKAYQINFKPDSGYAAYNQRMYSTYADEEAALTYFDQLYRLVNKEPDTVELSTKGYEEAIIHAPSYRLGVTEAVLNRKGEVKALPKVLQSIVIKPDGKKYIRYMSTDELVRRGIIAADEAPKKTLQPPDEPLLSVQQLFEAVSTGEKLGFTTPKLLSAARRLGRLDEKQQITPPEGIEQPRPKLRKYSETYKTKIRPRLPTGVMQSLVLWSPVLRDTVTIHKRWFNRPGWYMTLPGHIEVVLPSEYDVLKKLIELNIIEPDEDNIVEQQSTPDKDKQQDTVGPSSKIELLPD